MITIIYRGSQTVSEEWENELKTNKNVKRVLWATPIYHFWRDLEMQIKAALLPLYLAVICTTIYTRWRLNERDSIERHVMKKSNKSSIVKVWFLISPSRSNETKLIINKVKYRHVLRATFYWNNKTISFADSLCSVPKLPPLIA